MRRQSRLVTITALVACGSHTPEVPEPTPELTVAAPEPTPAPTTTPKPNKALNAVDAQGRMIYAGRDGGCYVHLPFPAGAQRPPGMRPPIEALDCPPEMQHESWSDCGGGTIWAIRDGEGCECRIMSNPPPAPRPIDCPG